MDHLNTYPDRELAAIRFMRFGSLQEARAILANLEYESDRGRTEHLRHIADSAAPNILRRPKQPSIPGYRCAVRPAQSWLHR